MSDRILAIVTLLMVVALPSGLDIFAPYAELLVVQRCMQNIDKNIVFTPRMLEHWYSDTPYILRPNALSAIPKGCLFSGLTRLHSPRRYRQIAPKYTEVDNFAQVTDVSCS
jgi:hypothetical protein